MLPKLIECLLQKRRIEEYRDDLEENMWCALGKNDLAQAKQKRR